MKNQEVIKDLELFNKMSEKLKGLFVVAVICTSVFVGLVLALAFTLI